MPVLKLPITDEDLAELQGEGDVAFFATLAIQGQQKVVHIHIRYRKFYDRISAAAVNEGGAAAAKPPRVQVATLETE